jgi:hypothetical protein
MCVNADRVPAVLIGCCPAFAMYVNAFRTKTAYDSRGYHKYTQDNNGERNGSNVQLRAVRKSSARTRDDEASLETTELYEIDARSSLGALETHPRGVTV